MNRKYGSGSNITMVIPSLLYGVNQTSNSQALKIQSFILLGAYPGGKHKTKTMIKVIIVRDSRSDQTPGRLLVYDQLDFLYICHTLELPWIQNKQQISCIPAGIYQVNKVDKPPRGKHFRLIDVPGRSGILIHAGNYASGKSPDTFGCILPGRTFEDVNGDYHMDVTSSRQVLSELWSLLPDDFLLTII